MNKRQKGFTPIVIALIVLVLIGIGSVGYLLSKSTNKLIENNISNTFPNKDDLIIVESLFSNSEISSPLTVFGKARGTWFFEGEFPIVITDKDGVIIAESYATTNEGEWMTEEYIPFSGTINFTKPNYANNGFLIFKKNNPSDLREHDNALKIPIIFK